MRHPLVMGNWKLNGSRHMVNELVANLRKELAGVTGCAVAIAPPDMSWIWLNVPLTAATSFWAHRTLTLTCLAHSPVKPPLKC